MKLQTFPKPIEREDDIPLYKYIDRDTFYKFLDNKQLFFRCVPEWKDQLEGVLADFAKHVHEKWSDFQREDHYAVSFSLQDFSNETFDTEREKENAIEELQKHGSAAMWESYCKDSGVRIKTTVGKVKQLFGSHSYIHGAVKYKPLKNLQMGIIKDPAYMFFYKGVSYIFENEYRFILKPDATFNDLFYKIEIDNIKDFIDEILVFPTEKKDDKQSREVWEKLMNTKNLGHFSVAWKHRNEKRLCRMSCLYDKKSHEL